MQSPMRTAASPKHAEYAVELGQPQSKVTWGQVAKESSVADKCGSGQNAWLFVQNPHPIGTAATMQAEEEEREDDHVWTVSVLSQP